MPKHDPIAGADEVEAGCRGASMSWPLSRIPARALPRSPAQYPAFFEPA